MVIDSNAEQVPLSLGVSTGWKKQEYHKNIHYGNPCSDSQCLLLLVHKGRQASSQQTGWSRVTLEHWWRLLEIEEAMKAREAGTGNTLRG